MDVVMTASAAQFVGPLTFEALTGRPVLQSLWEPGVSLDHVRWARDPDLVLVAPATANLIARAAQGLADDFLTTMLLVRTADVLIAPAMNDDMFAQATTQENLTRLIRRGWHVIGPAVGPLAEGPSENPGRMEEPDHIISETKRLLASQSGKWTGQRMLVTAGATREQMDPVRVVTNRSSGRMGYEIARAGYERGADVTLVTGPSSLPVPWGVEVERVETTEEMLNTVAQKLPDADVVIMAAAPADFRPTSPVESKRPRADGLITMVFEPTPDILASTRGARKPGATVIGFALETTNGLDRAKNKLERKDLDFIVLNFANEPGAGFESETNRITLVSRSDVTELPKMLKSD